ncbi:MAG: ImmA/IrrE family metallo-endopeptidase [Parachlamydiales bacterium]|jgi:addiction module HigA family antidote
MTRHKQNSFKPDWIVPPGATIADVLEEKGWSQAEFAQRMEYTTKHVNLLIQGKASITEDAAIRLERVLGSTVNFWLNREALYREAIARKEDLLGLNGKVNWLAQLPIKEMLKWGWVNKCSEKSALVAECLKFFGVASVEAYEARYAVPVAAFRASRLEDGSRGFLTAWLRQGERVAMDVPCKPYNKEGFLAALKDLRNLTCEVDQSVFIPRLIEICAAVGVAVAIVPAPKGCAVSGATRWLGVDKALLLLSNRYKTNDQFWFSFFHEAGHLLLHGKKLMFIDIEGQFDEQLEKEADVFAAKQLIPSEMISELLQLERNETAIKQFAQKVGIGPGIVVGRLQREGLLTWQECNHLKIKIQL